jgi:hypothetical protein
VPEQFLPEILVPVTPEVELLRRVE